MWSSSILANSLHLLWRRSVLFPFGHHSTLPFPIDNVPRNSSPRLISMFNEFSALSLVKSMDFGRNAVTVVSFLRFAIEQFAFLVSQVNFAWQRPPAFGSLRLFHGRTADLQKDSRSALPGNAGENARGPG